MSLSPKLLRLLVIGLLLVALPVIIFLVKQQQDLRSKAFDTVTLKLTPPTLTKNLNDPLFDVVVSIDGGNLDVSGIDITVNFSPTILELTSFTPSGVYNSVLLNGPPNNTTGSIRIILANNSSTPIVGSNVVLGTLHFRGKTIGTSPVTFVPNQITAAGRTTAIATTNNTTGSYTISNTSPSPSPSSTPGPTVSLVLSPATLTKNLSDTFDINLSINAGNLDISGVDIRLTFNPSILEMVPTASSTTPFTPSNTYNSVIQNGPPDNTAGSFRYIAANTSAAAITGNIQLGTIHFKGKALGTSQVTLFANQITAAGQTNNIGTAGNINGSYTIGTGSPPPAGAPSDVTISSLPSCLDAGSSMSTAQKQAARISWNSTASSFWVDMSPSSSFSPLYHKRVSGLTTDLTGFNKDNVFPETEIVISPNTNYFVRVFDEVNNLHSATIPVINIPQCSVTACTYQSTQVKFRLNTIPLPTWTSSGNVTQNQSVYLAGFHNNDITTMPTDISLSVEDPSPAFVPIPSGNNVLFTPTQGGDYVIRATTNDQAGAACTGTLTMHVTPASPLPPPPVTTTDYRLAETTSALDSATWKLYTTDPTETTFTFADKLPGAKKVCVQFRGSDGSISTPQCQSLELVTDPEITGCNLDFDQNGNLAFKILGKNFGSTKGTIESETVPLSTTGGSWTDNQVITGKTTSPPTGTDFNLTLTTSQGLSAEVVCSSVAQLSLGAKLFCPQVTPRDIPGVEVTIVEATTSGKTFKETSTLTKNGTISLKTKLIEGMGYKLALDVPKSIRKVVEFIAARDTTSVDITPTRTNRLALGDIFPLDGGDGAINSADKSEMNREWVIDKSAKTSGERAADLNVDSLVNSFDWSCMRQDFNAEDDPLPTPGALSTVAIQTFTPNVVTIPFNATSSGSASGSGNN